MAISRLPDAELVIMQIIWQVNGDTTSAHICQELDGKRDWAVTTVLNFLARLVDRGFLSVRRNGKTNIYAPIVDEDVYLENESKSFLERLHGNSLKSFVTALYEGKAIDQQDLAELRQFIDEHSLPRGGEK